MKKSILSFAVILISCSLLRATDVPAGDVSGTWTRSGSPYNILGDIGIPYNQVLTIEPGVEVIFQGPYRLNVYQGDLIAVGTPGEMILFTMARFPALETT